MDRTSNPAAPYAAVNVHNRSAAISQEGASLCLRDSERELRVISVWNVEEGVGLNGARYRARRVA
jgi:putative aminopeptidase FrvX